MVERYQGNNPEKFRPAQQLTANAIRISLVVMSHGASVPDGSGGILFEYDKSLIPADYNISSIRFRPSRRDDSLDTPHVLTITKTVEGVERIVTIYIPRKDEPAQGVVQRASENKKSFDGR